VPEIKAIVFDIGNVLIEWNPERVYDREIGPEARARLFAEVDLHGMNLGVDRGAPFRASVAALAENHPDWADAIWLWHDRWLDMASPRIPASVHLFETLLEGPAPVYGLTNFGIETFARAQVHYPFMARFRKVFVSGHLKCIKPEPAIYEALEGGVDEAPETLLFIDDRAENIAAAAARGWQTQHFDGPDAPATLARRLVAEGLLRPQDIERPAP
jgi:2-haloacid dehalogenase